MRPLPITRMEMEAAAAAMETEMNFRRRARVLASLPGGRFGRFSVMTTETARRIAWPRTSPAAGTKGTRPRRIFVWREPIIGHRTQIFEADVSAAGRPDQLLRDKLAAFVVIGNLPMDLFEHQVHP